MKNGILSFAGVLAVGLAAASCGVGPAGSENCSFSSGTLSCSSNGTSASTSSTNGTTGGGGGGTSAGTGSGTCNLLSFDSSCLVYQNETTSTLTSLQSSCAGTWSSGIACPSTNLVAGNCAFASDSGKIQFFYTSASAVEHSGFNAGSAQIWCQAETGGIWVP